MSYDIHQGDALEILRTMPDQSVDCILTGPPYYGEPLASDDPRAIGDEETGEKYLARLVPVFDECMRVLKRSGFCYVVDSGYLLQHPSEIWFVEGVRSVYSDAHESLVLLSPMHSRPIAVREAAFPEFQDDELFRSAANRNLKMTRSSASMDPEIARYCIRHGSKPGDTILDPFAGTGVTISTAVSMGRNAIGIEIAPSQIALIEKRMELLDSQVLERR